MWFAVGLHAGWDYAESFVFGVPNSGLTLPGYLLHARFDGPAWLTGGSAGPEGSLLILVVFAAMVMIIRKLSPTPAGANSESPSLAAWPAPTRPRS